MNAIDILLLILLVLAAIFAIRTLFRKKDRGCGCGCGGCSFHDECGSRSEK